MHKIISTYSKHEDFLVFFGMNLRRVTSDWQNIKEDFDGDIVDFLLDKWKEK